MFKIFAIIIFYSLIHQSAFSQLEIPAMNESELLKISKEEIVLLINLYQNNANLEVTQLNNKIRKHYEKVNELSDEMTSLVKLLHSQVVTLDDIQDNIKASEEQKISIEKLLNSAKKSKISGADELLLDLQLQKQKIIKKINSQKSELKAYMDQQKMNQALIPLQDKEIKVLKLKIKKNENEIAAISEKLDENLNYLQKVKIKINAFYFYSWSKENHNCLIIDKRNKNSKVVDEQFCIDKIGVNYDFVNGQCAKFTTENFLLSYDVSTFDCVAKNGHVFEWRPTSQGLQCFQLIIPKNNIKEGVVTLDNSVISYSSKKDKCEQSKPSQMVIKEFLGEGHCFRELSVKPYDFIRDERTDIVFFPEGKIKGVIRELSSKEQITLDTVYSINECIIPEDVGIYELDKIVRSENTNRFYHKLYKPALQAMANRMVYLNDVKSFGQSLQNAFLDPKVKKEMIHYDEKMKKHQKLKKRIKYDKKLMKLIECELQNSKKIIPQELKEEYINFANDFLTMMENLDTEKGNDKNVTQLMKVVHLLNGDNANKMYAELDKTLEEFLVKSGLFMPAYQRAAYLKNEIENYLMKTKQNESYLSDVQKQLIVIVHQNKLLENLHKKYLPLVKSNITEDEFKDEMQTLMKIRGRSGVERREEYLRDKYDICWLFVNEIKYYRVDSKYCPIMKESKSHKKLATAVVDSDSE